MLQQEQYKIALSYFNEATKLHEAKPHQGTNNWTRETFATTTESINSARTTDAINSVRTSEAVNRVLRREWFILACRFFNKGLAKLALLKQIQKEEQIKEDD